MLKTSSGYLSRSLSLPPGFLPWPGPLKSCVKYGRRWYTFYSTDDSSVTIRNENVDAKFPFIWLRDACQSPDCVHPSTSQKLHRTSDVPIDIKPASGGIKLANDGLQITWNSGHESFYPFSFLQQHASPSALSSFHKDIFPKTWDSTHIANTHDLYLTYEALRTPSGLVAAITQLSKYGLLFVSGVPNAETSDERCELRTLATLFGEIRDTFYGAVWNVKNIRNSRNIAYTNLDLGLHMDLLYFQHPPRYQILHCLRNRVVGGTSIFVDALHVASVLRSKYPEDFDALASTPVPFHYINDGHHLHYAHPTIELASFSSLTPTLHEPTIAHINYSPPFQAPLFVSTPPAFYSALARFAGLLNDAGNKFEYTLREGDAVIFDNRRVLHARTAFSDSEGNDGEANRWLKGCYLEADALLDRGRVLRT